MRVSVFIISLPMRGWKNFIPSPGRRPDTPQISHRRKKKFFLVKMWFSDFFKKFQTFPPTDGETPEIENFHKRPKIF